MKINSFKMKFNIRGINDDGSDMVEPGWKESNEMKSLAVDCYKDEEDDIN